MKTIEETVDYLKQRILTCEARLDVLCAQPETEINLERILSEKYRLLALQKILDFVHGQQEFTPVGDFLE